MNTGVSATLVFSSGITFSARFRSISPIRRTVEALDDTALNSTDYKEKVPDDLADIEAFDCEIYTDGTKDAPQGTVGTITLTYPLQAGQTTPKIIAGTGFITAQETPSLEVSVRLTETITVQFDGKTGPTVTLAS